MSKRNIDVLKDDQASFYEREGEKSSQPSEKKGVALEGVDTIREEAAPTVLEGRDLQEVDEDGLSKVEVPSSDEFYQGLGGREKFDQQIADIEGKLGEETSRDFQEILREIQEMIFRDESKEEFVDSDFDEQFDRDWERLDQSLDQSIEGALGEAEALAAAVEVLTSDVEKLVDETGREEDKVLEVSVQTDKELKLWDTDLGRQRVESLAKFAKRGLSKAGGLLKGFLGGRVKESLLSFGSTMRDLGYGSVSLGENLPKAGIKKMSSGVKAIASESVAAYKKVAIEFPAEIKRTKEKMTVWQEERKKYNARAKEVSVEQKERQEFEKLRKRLERFESLRTKFGE